MQDRPVINTTVCVVGGGPAGAMLSLLLARAGIDVVLLEKHRDFLRDFRGDTVHPSTLQLLDELGMAEQFHRLPLRKVHTIGFVQDGLRVDVADFRLLKLKFPYIAFVPQWDFLTLLVEEAARYPNFRLMMQAEGTGLRSEGCRVNGVKVHTGDGDLSVSAHLTVGADGRHSAIRDAAGFIPRDLGANMDVMIFQISRRPDDPDEGLSVRVGNGRVFGAIDRGSYWQVTYETGHGGYERLCEDGIEALRTDVALLVPFLADRVNELASLSDVRLLRVRMDRLHKWSAPGLLFIGDAAHAMSPIGGFGVNLAVQDAVATANLLVDSLRHCQAFGTALLAADLAKVQRRRYRPTVMTQALQLGTQRAGVSRALRGDKVLGPHPGKVLRALPMLKRAMSRVIGVGFRPEHVGRSLWDEDRCKRPNL